MSSEVSLCFSEFLKIDHNEQMMMDLGHAGQLTTDVASFCCQHLAGLVDSVTLYK